MDPRSAYRESAIRGASGVRLVIFLYEQVIQDLRRAAVAMDDGEVELRTKEINHALLVIGHLQGTLDRDQGAGVSRNLDRFYCSVRRRLFEAHVQISKDMLFEQISYFLSMREAWIEVDRAAQAATRAPLDNAGGDRTTFAPAPAPSPAPSPVPVPVPVKDWGKY